MSDKQIYFVLNEREMSLLDDCIVLGLGLAEKSNLPQTEQELKKLMYKLRAHVSSVRDVDENEVIKVRLSDA